MTGTLGRGTPPFWESQCSSLRIPTPGTSRQAALLVRRLALVAGAGACSVAQQAPQPWVKFPLGEVLLRLLLLALHVHCRRHSLAGSQELHSQWGESCILEPCHQCKAILAQVDGHHWSQSRCSLRPQRSDGCLTVELLPNKKTRRRNTLPSLP